VSGKANNRDSTHTKNNKQVNSVPNLVFQPFKANRIYITILGLLSTGLCIFLFVKVMQNAISFSSDQLNEISNFAVNINLVVGALGLAIFLLPIKSDQNQKETLLIRYVGSIMLSTSCAILGYIISYSSFLNDKIISIYCVAMLLILSGCVLHTVSTMVAFFNIRD
jgi:hypothetical protein